MMRFTRSLVVLALAPAALSLAAPSHGDPIDRVIDRSYVELVSTKPAYDPDQGDRSKAPYEGIAHVTPRKTKARDKYYEAKVDLALPPYHCYAAIAAVKKGAALAVIVGGQIQPRASEHADQQIYWDRDATLHGAEVTWVEWCQTPANGKVRLTMWSTQATPISYRLFTGPMPAEESAALRAGVARCMKRAGATAAYCEGVSWCGADEHADRCKPMPAKVGDLIANARREEAERNRQSADPSPAEPQAAQDAPAFVEVKDVPAHDSQDPEFWPGHIECNGTATDDSFTWGGTTQIWGVLHGDACTLQVKHCFGTNCVDVGSAQLHANAHCTIEHAQLACD